MKKLLPLFLAIAAFAEPATNYFYKVTVSDLCVFTNVVEVVREHEAHCHLIRYVSKGATNDFHAWLVPIKVERQK